MNEAPQGNRTGRGPAIPVSSEMRDKAMRELMTAPVIEPATLSVVLDVGLQAALREAAAGRFGAFKIGRIYKIPTPQVREALGLPASPILAPASADHAREAA